MKARVTVLVILALGILAAPLATDAQQKVARIGELFFSDPSTAAPFQQALREGLQEWGYVEGQNIAFETRWARGRERLLRQLAVELVRLRVDVIFVGTTPSLQAARQATKAIPIVAIFDDPVGEGFVESLARPGGNITGFSSLSVEVSEKRIELLREAVPKLSRVAVLFDPADRGAISEVRSIRDAARTIGLALDIFEVGDGDELTTALAAIKKARSQALVVIAGARSLVHRARIAEFALRNRLPSISELRSFADEGLLMTYGPNIFDLFRRAAFYVDKILKGSKPGDLPIEQPTKFELVINLKTAKALGLTIPQSVLVRADEIIR